jgi:hypothetical protein
VFIFRTVLTLSSDYFQQQVFVVQDLSTCVVTTRVLKICYPKTRSSNCFKAYYEICDRNVSKEVREIQVF